MQRGPLSEGGALGALRPRSPEGRGHGPHSAGVPWRGPCSQLTHQQESRVALRPLALPSTPPRPPGCLGCHLLARPSLSTPGHRRELFRTADEWGCWAQARGAGSTDPEAAEPWTGLGREDEAREAGPSWGTPATEAWPARRGGGASLLQLRGTRRPPRRPRASPQEQSLHELPPAPRKAGCSRASAPGRGRRRGPGRPAAGSAGPRCPPAPVLSASPHPRVRSLLAPSSRGSARAPPVCLSRRGVTEPHKACSPAGRAAGQGSVGSVHSTWGRRPRLADRRCAAVRSESSRQRRCQPGQGP